MAAKPVYKAEFAEQAYKLCLLGAIDRQLGDFFGVSENAINEWKHRHPAFGEALRRGKTDADAKVADSLFRRANGYSHEATKIAVDAKTGKHAVVPYTEHYPPDTAACIFWLKNRRKDDWKERVSNEHTGPGGGPVQVEKIERVIVDPTPHSDR